VGILTGGGDAPGLNAVLRAFTRNAVKNHGRSVVGVMDSFNGLLDTPRRLMPLTPLAVRGLLHRGGTVIGTTNRGDPFGWRTPGGKVDRSAELARAVADEGLEGLVVVGGDGTQAIAWRLMAERGIPVIGVPKTIDNDLGATDVTFGFQTAVDIATDALDRLHTTAESHERILVLEVMGRDAGHLALHAGLSGGADVLLLPEIPWEAEYVAAAIAARRHIGRTYTLVVVAEGALPGAPEADAAARKARLRKGGGAGAIVAAQLEGAVDAEVRVCVLGHVQRGGTPTPADRLLATRMGVAAADLVAEGRWGEMVVLRGGSVQSVPLPEAIAVNRGVDPEGELVRTARALGVSFGDKRG
jgi:6-phosphofructokinase 1